MTKQEAIKLENRCDKIMSGYVGEECEVSLALTGRLKIIFCNGDGYVTLKKTRNEADYISYIGDYDELIEKIAKIVECVDDNREIFDQLIWSYEHITELEE